MGVTMSTALPDLDESTDLSAAPLEPWQVVVWNDPVNLMSYVVRVFRTYFGYTEEHATALMLAVHNEGHAIVATGPRETMEVHAQAMHDYGLWATVRKASA
ncbi:ATP-dependent Clp protease adapter ClpS [Microbacterium sufflavum]|uniref:ATP-dependent Clp protease adapter protein ClpS n=2 Tax=Microbacteriaceae TaxID=85023 RepID=A0ABY4IJA7_9MICO|nr:ATP-dependent Clp protease adapter ClpS [Microbacterium sufflavum]UPL12036.1 ATP-dependent Clp protease adapter ClpS [Microbacterium sufflavum]